MLRELTGARAASDRPSAAADAPNRTIARRRVGPYVCHLAFNLGSDELEALLGSIALHTASPAAATGVLGGRAATWRREIPVIGPVVIKEYRRGGMFRHLRRRHYLRFGPTRPERELRILQRARAAGVSAPEPVACVTRGLLFYRGWLATRRVDGTSLALLAPSMNGDIADVMDRVTQQVRLLVDHRIAHADLHPGNVLVDPDGVPFLLDFDKAIDFDGPLEELREHYRVRWTRAVGKYGLPDEVAERFRAGLQRLPRASG